MPKINLLDKNVSELIAAGEVIERPASIVKELLENAVDSGATNVTIEIRRGGKSLIRVTDNGCGIAAEDVPKAFLRHATSKISDQDDLDRIGTLGFRGEALASICAVAKVELLTKPAEQEYGTRYLIQGGEEVSLEPYGCSAGTTILVRDVFYNVPARLKFLKKDVTEANSIQSIVDKIALSHPEVSFQMLREGKQVLHTPGNGDLFAVIYAVFGREFATSLMKVDSNHKVKVTGFTSIPTQTRSNRSMQHFFINGRYVKSKTCIAALEEAYKGSIMVGKFPACVLELSLPLDSVDVNVHPAKIEVRFSDEQAVFEAVYFAVKQAIAKDNQLTQQPEQPQVKPHIERVVFHPRQQEQTTLPKKATFQQSKPDYHSEPEPSINQENYQFLSRSSFQKKQPEQQPVSRLEDRIILEEPLPEEPKPESVPTPEPLLQQQETVVMESQQPPEIRLIGELFQTYILAEIDGMFVAVDKHAAHERILYEELKAQNDHPMERQLLLSPIRLTLSREEYGCVLDHLEQIQHMGFLAENFGDRSILIREIPLVLDQHNCQEVFEDLINNICQNKKDITPKVLDDLYHSMACKAAIKANDHNTPEELYQLLQRVWTDESIRYCPHGRPVILTFTKERFEKQFGRT
ncbi:DNA mismatch repair endonuclease MutL [Clostridium facile]|uniref:DNA mismatch repair protein MutL n=1 Tax=Clostridium facile TaxID=2763035 RepID=A0ABR7IQ56_9CLOT|nr:DNA mismatch repair endonuclease MutL [Clostridium facile]